MFIDRQLLHESLEGLVGAYQTTNPEYPLLASSLLVSRSCRYWSNEHRLLSIENIDQCLTNFTHYNYTAYNGATTYALYEKVSYSGSNYECILASTGNLPTDVTYWVLIDELSDYLLRTDYKATDLTLDSVMNMKKIRGEVKTLLNSVQLFEGRDEYSNLVTNSGRFVGLRITPKSHNGLATIFHKFSHQFNNTLTDVNLYLFHSSQVAPLETWLFSHTTANSSQWTSLANYIVRYISDSYNLGGDFYLGYFQDDISTVQAISRNVNWTNYVPCCDIKRQFRQYSKYVDVVGFSFDSSDLNGTNLPNIDNIQLDANSNFGLNLQLSTKCDLTPFIIQQEDLIAECKSLNMAYLLMQDLAYNTRGSNALANQVKEQAKKELMSFKDVWGTLNDKLQKATKALDFDLSGLNSVCLPCKDKMNITVS